jgi:hypothetical protein
VEPGVQNKESKPANGPSSGELILCALLFLVLLCLRFFYVSTQLWDSDEPQHLHVVWAWANGLLPYRDLFDNHAPLFQAISAPLFRMLGERSDIVAAMRWEMVPIAAFIIAAIYFIGSRLFSPRVGLWGAAISAAFPDLYFKMGEYRPDGFWAALWMAILALLSCGPWGPKRLFLVGLLFGIAFCVSMKTTFLCLTVFVSAIVLLLFRFVLKGPPIDWRRIAKTGLATICGAVIMPIATVLFFASQNALGKMYYCVVTHNLWHSAEASRGFFERVLDVRFWLFVPMIIGGLWLAKKDEDPSRAFRRLFFLLVAGFYCPLLFTFWPLISKQDYIPFFPMVILVITVLLVGLGDLLHRFSKMLPVFLVPAVVAISELIWMIKGHPPLRQTNRRNIAIIEDILKLTNRDETVLDAKGQTIFRRRPYFYVFEQITRERVEAGELVDDAPQQMIAARTPVVIESHWLTKTTADFVDQNYIPVGSVMVLGKNLIPSADGKVQFAVVIPEKYAMMTDDGPVAGVLDGSDWREPRELAPGIHTLVVTPIRKSLAIVWSRAVEKGYSPFVRASAQN